MPAKRCPMCHRTTSDRSWQCACGYEFGQEVARTRELLRDQLLTAKIMLGIWVVVDLALMAVVVGAALYGVILFPMFALVGATVFTARVSRKILISRESLRALAPAPIPKAIAVKSAARDRSEREET